MDSVLKKVVEKTEVDWIMWMTSVSLHHRLMEMRGMLFNLTETEEKIALQVN